MEVMIVNGHRYLINVDSSSVDATCEMILKNHPQDAIIEFDTVKQIDL